MPVATKFEAEGVDNGFPVCLDKVDVSDRGDGQPYDYWITLGGFKKGDAGPPTDQQIYESRRNAMMLFWNLDGWSGRVSSLEEEITSLSIENDDWSDPNNTFSALNVGDESVLDPPFKPNERVCYKTYGMTKEVDPEIILSFNLDCRILRMYDGPTDDEDNFVGYGWQFLFAETVFPYFFSSYDNEGAGISLNLIEYINIPTNIAGFTIPAVGVCVSFGTPASGFDIFDWDTLTFSLDGTEFDEFRTDSLDFYTYPT